MAAMTGLGRLLLWGASLFGGGNPALATQVAHASAGGQFRPQYGGVPGSTVFSPGGVFTPSSPVMPTDGGVASREIGGAFFSQGLQSLGPALQRNPVPGPVMCGGPPTIMKGTGYYLVPQYVMPYSQPARAGSPTIGNPPAASDAAAISILYPGV